MNVFDNPVQTDGFEFVEYASSNPQELVALFEKMGFVAVARHRSKNVTLYRQGGVNFILNAEPNSQADAFLHQHGPSANAMAFRVKDAAQACAYLKERGAKFVAPGVGPMELQIPAIEGIGGALIYLVDRYGDNGDIYGVDFVPIEGVPQNPVGCGLQHIDHLTHNVERGRMTTWAKFYEDLFGFREIRYFDISGQHTALLSRAMTSPCGKIRIPLNESQDDKSQIAEYLRIHNGEGIQHIALSTLDIYQSVAQLRAGGMQFMPTPDTYYDALDERLPKHGEDVARLKELRILLDGEPMDKVGREDKLLQIFTETVIGPLFFEIIQRKGNDGFGEGNFKALFDSIELDQIKRGVL
ncbi:MAG: 4-hydroxyphenylpyruvate dioxygenase [Formosimonas sp.]